MVVELIERNAQSPNIALPYSFYSFLTQRFGAAVETAGLITKREIRGHRLVETTNLFWGGSGNCLELGLCHVLLDHPAIAVVDPCSCKDATRGHMSKGNIKRGAGVCQRLGEKRIALQRVGLDHLASIDIRLAGIASGIDDKARSIDLEVFVDQLKARVIELRA